MFSKTADGWRFLDDDEIERPSGVVAYVPREIRLKAIGKLTVLPVYVPPGVLDDVHDVE